MMGIQSLMIREKHAFERCRKGCKCCMPYIADMIEILADIVRTVFLAIVAIVSILATSKCLTCKFWLTSFCNHFSFSCRSPHRFFQDFTASFFFQRMLNPYKPSVPFLGHRQTVQTTERGV